MKETELTTLLKWFIRVVTTIIINITFPALGDAASIAALELSRATGPGGAVGWVLVRLITTVILTVALP